jgi:hypothetical protein
MESPFDPQAAAAIDRINAQIAAAQEHAEKAVALRDRVESIRERATSPDREISVEVDSLGRITDLELTEAAYAHTPAKLAKLILATFNDAHRIAGQTTITMAEATFGAESESVAALRETYLPPEPPESDDKSDDSPTPGRGPILTRR